MNKRDTITVIFRVIAIFVLFSLIINFPTIYKIWTAPLYLFETSLLTKMVNTLFVIGVPLGAAYLLWNRSDWIADKILAPFDMNELWADETGSEILAEENEENLPEEKSDVLPESTVTYLKRNEIEDIILTAISIWVLLNSIPDLLRILYEFLNTQSISWGYLIIPLGKTILASWLLLRTNNLGSWLSQWREHRMQD